MIEKALLHLDEEGALTDRFFVEVTEEEGHVWELAGRFRLSRKGVELLELSILSPANLQSDSAPPLTHATLRAVKLRSVKAAIGASVNELAGRARIQLAALSAMPPGNDHWDAIDLERQTADWDRVATDLGGDAQRAQKGAGGRPRIEDQVWACRAEAVLESVATGERTLYQDLDDRFKDSKSAIHSWLRTMRQPFESSDPRSGWLIGTGPETCVGPRLDAWRETQER